jgi:alanyl-tRNA synthetase
MDSAQIRTRFLTFFAERGHEIVPSASLLLDDPTLLFVNAGMVPFKPYFLGEAPAPYPRATSVQKVVRTLDIEEVGKTTRHASFFQMAGNFSFGDYFKEEAIPLAWELLTAAIDNGGYGFDPERLWVTVYQDDDEGETIWRDVVGVPAERIQRRGMEDNYWSMGVPGPCGPCSEIYYDRGPEFGVEGGPIADENRYLEVWNLVFMQFERGEGSGKNDFPILGPLPAANIDTGMGLERMAAILQDVDNIYEIDTTRGILDMASALSNAEYGVSEKDDIALRVVADHSRTCIFLISDGVIPGNEGRGYVLRRLMRRVIRNMRILGATEPTLRALCVSAIDVMAAQYPELNDSRERILSIATGEENAFAQTLITGNLLFDTAAIETKKAGSITISGEKAFALHDTYGFPIDLTMEMATEAGLNVDRERFTVLMKEQRDRAKADSLARKSDFAATTAYKDILTVGGTTEFTGYVESVSESKITGLVLEGTSVAVARVGDRVEVIMNRSPFYAESGGQLGDHGVITSVSGQSRIEVYDVQTPVPGLFLHRGRVVEGEVIVGESVIGAVDIARRKAISRAHTATHMVHRAFRERLGDTATQMGSENSPGRFRFDFPSPEAVSPAVLRDVEQYVNAMLIEDLTVSANLMSQQDAMDMGAMALFGEKYGNEVRVVSVGDWAHELCGGTHAQRTGALGLVYFVGEGSVGAGVRRVEALVGSDAYAFAANEHVLVNKLTTMLKVPADQIADRLESTISALKVAEKEITEYRRANLLKDAGSIVGEPVRHGDVDLWVFTAPVGTDANSLRQLAQQATSKGGNAVKAVAFGTVITDEKVSAVVAVNDFGVEAGCSAQKLLRIALAQLNGKGGGKDNFAQGAGTNASALPAAIASVEASLVAQEA